MSIAEAVSFANNEEARIEDVQRRLTLLMQSMQNFIVINSYELMIELIKKELKVLKRSEDSSSKDITWLLKKFMIAIDIHVLLKYNSWSGAADSIFNFVNTFYVYLEHSDKVKLVR